VAAESDAGIRDICWRQHPGQPILDWEWTKKCLLSEGRQASGGDDKESSVSKCPKMKGAHCVEIRK
jgi:hypothetical protein